ncbi:uncharacterized protein LOC129699383 isoform X1 [Leucoraja erinacea]|uniref:uncharacterized protein LOC129699383 isoform X1 n=1 Tax=Leucoraja erinaceus TaxID=7782 RepID=UPI0024558FE1|nr:uncharacterized protein LOC129699383 isoform X1 [Leucoraja erinacea]XP_055495081.1 uncharacterized protein LOC129699383 isoform X1 [Leucoraja erinacea]
MAVAQYFMKAEAANKIGKHLSKQVKAVESLASKLTRIGNRAPNKADVDVIQWLVQKAHCEAKEAYGMAVGYLREVQSVCENLMEEKGRIQEEMKRKKQELSALQGQLPTMREEKTKQKRYMRSLREPLRVAERALERQREHERSMEIARNVSIGIMFIPIIGTIAGGISAIACEVSRAEAEDNCRSLREEVRRGEEKVSKCSSDLQSCISRIEKVRNAIRQTKKRIQAVDDQLNMQQERLEYFFAIDCQLKHGTLSMNTLLGKVEVLEWRSEKFLNLDALNIVVQDVIAHILKLPNLLQGKILHLEPYTVNMLTTFSDQLRAIEWSDSDLSEWS